MMSQMVKQFMQEIEPKTNNKITLKQYQDWAAGFIFDGLRNLRYGQSFCNKFNITDNILFYTDDVASADKYIKENYIK